MHPRPPSVPQGKNTKKSFIDRNAEGVAHFHLVHRSQRDPRSADPEAPQRVLAPADLGQRKGTSVRISCRIILNQPIAWNFGMSMRTQQT